MIEPFVITQEDSDVTQTDTTADSLQDLFVYRVPIGHTIILRPDDVLCCDLDETDTTVAQNICQVKLEVRDASNEEKKPVLGPLQYASFAASGVGEFKDEDKSIHLDIHREMKVYEREYIALMVKNASPYVDKDTSFFSLRCHRERG